MARSRYDVGIVGCGPTGLALAKLLADKGVGVGIFERGYHAVTTPRATHIDDEVVRIFQTLGIAHEMEPDFYVPCTPYEFFDKDWKRFFAFPIRSELSDQGWRYDYMFHQPDFEQRLRDDCRATGLVDVHSGVDVGGLSQTQSEVVIQARNVETGEDLRYEATFVVGCDGASSTVRRAMGSELEDLGGTQRWLVTDTLLHAGVDDVSEALFSYCVEPPLQTITYVTTGKRRRRVEFKISPDAPSAAELERPESVWALLAPYIARDKGELERADVYEFHGMLAKKWRSGRVFIAGDAAHQMPPKAGQGLCSGFRDAINLAWKLAYCLKGSYSEALLDSYESERQPHARHWIEVSNFLAGMIDTMSLGQTPTPAEPQGDGQESASPQRPTLGPGLHADFKHGGELSIQPLGEDGTRMDDLVGYGFAIVARPEVFEAIDHATRKRWGALGATLLSPREAHWDDWMDQNGVAAAIVRPDRYLLGAATTATELEQMTVHLTDLLGLTTSDRQSAVRGR